MPRSRQVGPKRIVSIMAVLLGLTILCTPVAEPFAANMDAPSSGAGFCEAACDWPLYARFLKEHVQDDGRVIDQGPPQQTTSEGLSYALFFALVDNDPTRFDRLVRWTQNNLASGDLSTHLPAWLWGPRDDGGYGVKDKNSAADSDLWIAYDLLQAGRLWRQPHYTALGQALLRQIEQKEVVDLPGFGQMLLPGAEGFALADQVWRLNPSYLPLPLLRAAAVARPTGPWRDIATNAVRMMQAVAVQGFAPDWQAYKAGQGFVVDPVKGTLGSYDAIRTYLWAGLTSPKDPQCQALLDALHGMRDAVRQRHVAPEKVDTANGDMDGAGPLGFNAALLPYLKAFHDEADYRTLSLQVAASLQTTLSTDPGPKPLSYYDTVLTLFGQGADDGRFRFDADGQLIPQWSQTSSPG